MFSRILMPVDLSDRNGAARERVGELADRDASVVVLLHVIEEIQDVSGEEVADFYRSLRERAETALEGHRQALEKRGIAVETRLRTGRRGVEIVRCATEERCDLVVLRSHALSPERPTEGLGTVSHQVALAAGCAVLLLR